MMIDKKIIKEFTREIIRELKIAGFDEKQVSLVLRSQTLHLYKALNDAKKSGKRKVERKIKQYLLEEHEHYSKDNEYFKEGYPYIDSLEFEKSLNERIF